jgi:hypothetical protein
MGRGVAIASLLCGVSLAACGGGHASPVDGATTSPPASSYQTPQGFCAHFQKLTGGNLVGTWNVIAACAISTGAEANCADTTVSISLDAHGTVTFNADMTGSIDVTIDETKTSTVPMSCMAAKDCASLQATLSYDGGAGSLTVGATCAPSTTDPTRCACVETYSPRRYTGSGTYRFELPTYIVAWGWQGGYLVQGSTLTLDGLSVAGTLFDLIAQR